MKRSVRTKSATCPGKLIAALFILPLVAAAADITGDTVTTDLTVKGGSITLNNNSTTASSQLRFNSTNRISSFWLDAPGTWVWSHGTTPTDVMALDSSNALNLYDLAATSLPSIVLNPGNPGATPAIAPSITVGGNPVLTASNAQTILDSQGYLRVVGGVLNVPSSASSTSSTTGALTVAGGLGVAKDSWVNGIRIGRGAGNVVSNTGIGTGSLSSNNSSGTANTALGHSTLFGNLSGSHNTAIGHLSLQSNTIGWSNTAIGSLSLRHLSEGGGNVAIGVSAGFFVENGTVASSMSSSTLIGVDTRTKTNGNQNSIVIGHNAIGDGSNTTVIGNNSTVSTRLRGETKLETLRVSGQVILDQPQGDISMGIYE
jgi:hypothetical protein